MTDTPRDPAEYQTVEECVRDERWDSAWNLSFFAGAWFVWNRRLNTFVCNRFDLPICTDTMLAAAQEALRQEKIK